MGIAITRDNWQKTRPDALKKHGVGKCIEAWLKDCPAPDLLQSEAPAKQAQDAAQAFKTLLTTKIKTECEKLPAGGSEAEKRKKTLVLVADWTTQLTAYLNAVKEEMEGQKTNLRKLLDKYENTATLCDKEWSAAATANKTLYAALEELKGIQTWVQASMASSAKAAVLQKLTRLNTLQASVKKQAKAVRDACARANQARDSHGAELEKAAKDSKYLVVPYKQKINGSLSHALQMLEEHQEDCAKMEKEAATVGAAIVAVVKETNYRTEELRAEVTSYLDGIWESLQDVQKRHQALTNALTLADGHIRNARARAAAGNHAEAGTLKVKADDELARCRALAADYEAARKELETDLAEFAKFPKEMVNVRNTLFRDLVEHYAGYKETLDGLTAVAAVKAEITQSQSVLDKLG
jgi:hypothetical protein